jgi:putative ABC transport system permease protein
MIRQYFKQALNLMSQNRFYTVVYVAGTGLAISLVMVIAIVFHVKTADIAPESNRSRMLVVFSAASTFKDKDNSGTWAMLSYRTVRECFYALETPACVTAFADWGIVQSNMGDVYLSLPGSAEKFSVELGGTDANYWQVFRFNFLRQGQPYAEADFQSGVRRIVLSETTARRLFGSADAEGRTALVNDVEYTVSGVVTDVPASMPMAFAEAWVPFTTLTAVMEISWAEDVCGCLSACILARDASDFDAIRAELEQRRLQYSAGLVEHNFTLPGGRPYTYRQEVVRRMDVHSSYGEIILRYILGALLFLLVPAVNLSGLMSSRMNERSAEIGVRKAFGASRGMLVNQALVENLLLTLLGGLAGLVIAYLIVTGMGGTLFLGHGSSFRTADILSAGMLLNFHVFFYALCVCIVLNLISSLVPVWNAARKPIVNAINS